LNDTDATYTITTDTGSALNGRMFNRGLARLGDFDGAGADDLAIGYPSANSNLGAVVVVKGSSSFGSLTVPNATGAIQVNGTTAGGGLGVSVVGIGQFFGTNSNPVMVATASIAGISYSFNGQAVAGGVLSTANADDSTVGVGADRYGTPIGFLGPLGASPGAFTLGATLGRYVDLQLGNATTGPFLGTAGSAPAPAVRFVDSQSGNSFGIVNIGSGIRGTAQSVQFVGGHLDTAPDLVLAGQAENGKIYLISGAALTTLSGTVDVSTPLAGNVPGIIQVPNHFPADWANGYATGCVIGDSNDDGHGDFAIGEAVSGKPGRVAVFY